MTIDKEETMVDFASDLTLEEIGKRIKALEATKIFLEHQALIEARDKRLREFPDKIRREMVKSNDHR